MESLAIARICDCAGLTSTFLVSDYPPAREILRAAKRSFRTVETRAESFPETATGESGRAGPPVVVVHHRNVRLSDLRRMKRSGFRVVVFDQLAEKSVSCDLLVNASAMVPRWRRYRFPDGECDLAFGPKFSVLRDEILRARAQRTSRSRADRPVVLVTMGGVDRTAATLRVVEALSGLNGAASFEIVLGAGFPHGARLARLLASLDDPRFRVHRAVTNMGRRMARADLVVSAGGNTLFEAACIGTPAVVLWEDAHEEIQGRAFQREGCVACIGNGARTPIRRITAGLSRLMSSPDALRAMSRAGRRLVDGRGADRIARRIASLATTSSEKRRRNTRVAGAATRRIA